MLTRTFPQLSPSRLLKHMRMGSVQMLHQFLTTRMEPWGFIKPSAQKKVVHMKLSLCLSFYLRHSLMGYMVANTVGFAVEIVEALARSYIQVPIFPPKERIFLTARSNGRLGGYYLGLVPRVPRVAGHSPKFRI
jgi:hypothetical protein